MREIKIFLCAIFAVIFMTASYSYAGGIHTGTVLETSSGGGYTYMHIDENGSKYWIAGPQSNLGKGSQVRFDEQMWMHDFQSKALNRKFDSIMFVGAIQPASGASGKSSSTGASVKKAVSTKKAASAKVKILKPATSYPIRELYAKSDELNGKLVRVKGTVIKVSSGILGRNWVHIQDGTIYMGSSSIIFTSPDDRAEVGDEITAQGTLETDKDFGAGYFYDVIVQNSSFSK
jgi:hypothetical protein